MANKNTIVHRVAMEGADALERELKSIGEEGEKAWEKIKAGAESVARAGRGVNNFFKTVRADLKVIAEGAKDVSRGFNEIGAAGRDFGRNVALVSAAVTGLAVSVFALTKASADFVDEQFKAAEAAGLTLREYGRLQFAFEQGNISAEQFSAGMKILNQRIAEAAKGTGAGAKAFQELGIRVKNADGSMRPTEEILADLADRFAKLPNGALKSALAVQLFGRAGAAMVPVLNEGGAALKALGDDAERVGRVFTENQAAIGDAFGDALNRMTSAIQGIRTQIGLLLAPAFTEVFDTITALIAENKDAILAFGQSLADQVIPLVRDLVSMLNGDDAAVANKSLLAIRDTVLGIAEAAQTVFAVVSTVFDILAKAVQPIADLINTLFGTELTGATLLLTLAVGQLLGVFRLLGAGVKGVQLIFAGLTKMFGTTTGLIVNIGARILLLRALLSKLFEDVTATVGQWLNDLGGAFQGFVDLIAGFFTEVGETIMGVFEGVFNFLKDIIDLAGQAIDAIASAFGGGGEGGDAPQSNARGGHIRGKGTGTSDSILSWLSNGEFVMRAKAVKKWGVRALNALNAGRLPAFASGGLVMPRSVPSFSTGGSANAGGERKAFDLHIGAEVFEDLLAPETVADKLVQFATQQNLRRGGSKPSWNR